MAELQNPQHKKGMLSLRKAELCLSRWFKLNLSRTSMCFLEKEREAYEQKLKRLLYLQGHLSGSVSLSI